MESIPPDEAQATQLNQMQNSGTNNSTQAAKADPPSPFAGNNTKKEPWHHVFTRYLRPQSDPKVDLAVVVLAAVVYGGQSHSGLKTDV